jgi:CubicO group peptidase (beta-lactamase class C family)
VPVQPALADVVREQLERRAVPGLALGIAAHGEVETAAYGTASVDTGVPVRPDSVFRIASITKPFTATLAFVLAEQEKLALDEPVLTGEGITLRHLLSHQSGLDCELPGGLDGVGSLQLIDASSIRRWTPPGELWAYSNAGFWIAGAAIERASGQSFEDAMREHVLAPLGLERTTFELEEALLWPAAVGHEPVGDPRAREQRVVRTSYRFPRVRRPSGGLLSTVGDLLRFADAHSGERFAPMREALVDAIGCSWGLGWRLERVDGVSLALHDGGYAGFVSRLLLAPAHGFAFAALANSVRGDDAIDVIADAALELVCGVKRERPQPVAANRDVLDSVRGRYRQAELDVVVEPRDGELELDISAYDVSRSTWDAFPAERAVPVGDRTFLFPGTRDLFDFPRDGLMRFGGRFAERT